MPDKVNVAVIYYSATGHVHALAKAMAEGAEEAGAEVRLRRVKELAPEEAIAENDEWKAHREATRDLPVATTDDLEWADAVLFGSPTRYGGAAAQLREFIDSTGPLWAEDKLADKVYGAFTSAATVHGGQETTILELIITFHHWGGIVVTPGYTASKGADVGNPHGTSHTGGDGDPDGDERAAARFQAERTVRTAAALKAGRMAMADV